MPELIINKEIPKIADVVLINLPKPYLREPQAQQPLGILYLAAVLDEYKKYCVIKNYCTYTHDQITEDLPPAKLYGITATSLEIPEANRVAKLIKRKYPDALIALGGPGVLAEAYVDRAVINYINYGEGENTILEILKDAEKGVFRNVYYGTPADVDRIPEPARGLLDYQGGNIFAYGHKYKGDESTIIMFSRGCPYKCAFCSAPALNSTLRYRDPANVKAEIENVIFEYGIRQFRFSDDMFTSNRKKVIELCEEIGPLDIAWRVSCRVKPIDKKMLKIMYEAGCKELSFGVESFDNDVLRGLDKKATALDNIKALEMAHDVGFKTRVLFMIRTPFQSRRTVGINKFYLQRVPFDIVAVTAFIPIPGCDVWYNPASYDIEILSWDLDKYNFYSYDAYGRRPIEPIIKIKSRSLETFHKESEDFRDWLEYDLKKVNKG